MRIRRCLTHSLHYDVRWGCSFCPDEFDALVVHALRENERLSTAIHLLSALLVVLALAWLSGGAR